MRLKNPPQTTPLFDWHEDRARLTRVASDLMNRSTSPKKSGVPEVVAFHRGRLREIEALISHRYAAGCVDTHDEPDIYVRAAAPHILGLPASTMGPDRELVVDPLLRLTTWARKWVPSIFDEVDLDWWTDVADSPRWLRADAQARLLHVTKAEREALNITRTGAVDYSKRERAKADQERRRQRARERRQAAGATPRSESKARTEPWLAAGFNSRRTWERHLAKTRVADSCPNEAALEHAPGEARVADSCPPKDVVLSARHEVATAAERQRFRPPPPSRSHADQLDILTGGPPPKGADPFEGFTRGKLSVDMVQAIRDEQYRRGLDQAQFGEQVDLSQPQISNMFSRRFGVSRQTAERLRSWWHAAA